MTFTTPQQLICKRPDGWEAWCYLSNGQQLSRRFATEPTESELTAWGNRLVAQAEAEVPVSQENPELASLAIAAKAILERSPKLQSPEILGMLDQLVAGVKSIAQADPDDGAAATRIVEKMLADPQLQAQSELHSAIAEALLNIQTITGGVL